MTFSNSTWDESKHPRDDIGRFTFKEGDVFSSDNFETKENPKDILYKLSKDKEDKVKYRNKLIDILGDKLTPAQILYSKTDELEEKLKEKIKENFREIIPHKNKAMAAAKLGDYEDNKTYSTPANYKEKYSTPIEELDKRKKGYCLNPYKIDNSVFSDEELERAREFIYGKEDFRAEAYKPLKSDKWTIGYGHTKGVMAGDKITKEEAEKLYRQDFKEHSDALKVVKVPLTKNQKVALSSFAFNIGPTGFKNSDVVKILNTGDYKGAADELLNYNKHKGKYNQGLYDRRKEERELFLKPD